MVWLYSHLVWSKVFRLLCLLSYFSMFDFIFIFIFWSIIQFWMLIPCTWVGSVRFQVFSYVLLFNFLVISYNHVPLLLLFSRNLQSYVLRLTIWCFCCLFRIIDIWYLLFWAILLWRDWNGPFRSHFVAFPFKTFCFIRSWRVSFPYRTVYPWVTHYPFVTPSSNFHKFPVVCSYSVIPNYSRGYCINWVLVSSILWWVALWSCLSPINCVIIHLS